ncbi:MAG: carboxypeptidase-like regulatory domain-containing protein [Bryobacterales bacterium]|nr:carboxypeptidase-like regulatory domain-containing protein [Bryobacteraceae bacterium]MDW8355009.1 carboxypeptidase-like regulatory domain-containing protein [Bryobacterales bacterium]
MSKRTGFRILLGIALAATTAAQTGPSGGLSGTVVDATGLAIKGARVRVIGLENGLTRDTASNDTGQWEVRFLPVGRYRVEITADGFQKLVQENVPVEASVVLALPAKLAVAALETSITVVSEIPLVSPNSATTVRQIDARELLEVPTSTRSFTHLLSAEPGVSADLPPVLVNGTGNISPSVNGLRTTANSVQFNGVDATNLSSNEGSLADNIAPAPETLEEVKLQTSLYDASVGRSGGGNFQLITRSGGNEWHGSVYGYAQNEAFNANDFFYNREGIERPRARRWETGFTAGGPIKKDKVFFFGGYQRTKAQTAFVPTAQSLSHLPDALRLVTGQRTAESLFQAFRQANPNFSLSDPSQIDPVALKLFQLRNPVTGDYVIPSPAGKPALGRTTDGAGNPLTLVRNVVPADFWQHQFTTKLDAQLTAANRLSGTFFFSNFPGLDPFPDPSSLASPFTLRRDDRARALALTDIHTFGPSLTSETRFGVFLLDNSRRLDDPFLPLTNESVGLSNPALLFDRRPATERLGHFVFRGPRFSFGGPNDAFNQRDQRSYSAAHTVSWFRGSHSLRFGAEFKRHYYNTNLPEEQGLEFEKFVSFDQLLRGWAQEGDTQFGITQKHFRMNDFSWFVADDWKLTRRLTLNLGLRWDWFGWPVERDGRIGNVDFALLNDLDNPVNAFIVPSNVRLTGIRAVDGAIEASRRAATKHTLRGQDLNNFQPRFGLAYSPLASGKLVVRGGYGIFFDRPSAAFMNTVFSNYPFLREIEVTYPSGRVPMRTAFSQQDPNLPFNRYLPMRITFSGGPNGNYVLRDGTGVTRGADGTLNPVDPITGQPALGNVAETFEFRAVDRGLRTPYIQQWNFGIQYQFAPETMLEVRYAGTKGTKLLQAIAFNQGFDLNDPATPDYVYERFNRVYVASGAPRGPLNPGATARERGVGRAFGFQDPLTGQINLNYGRPVPNATTSVVIPFEARAPILGFNIPEALLLQSNGNSIYHGLQLGLNRRFSRGLQLRGAYTFAKAIDTSSTDPGSTAGSGRPDVPNSGFVVQGDQRNLRANRALSDLDRTHRFSLSYTWQLPGFAARSRWVQGWQVAGFVQAQSGAPFSIFYPEPEANTPAALAALGTGSGGLFRLGFGRPSLAPGATLADLRRSGPDPTLQYFNVAALASPRGGFGNLGRNVLRGPRQVRFDLALSKETRLSERASFEFRWEAFNIFNHVNFALPSGDLSDSEFNTITNTVGGPRTLQFGARIRF